MRHHAWAAMIAVVAAAACDGTGSADGARGPCAAGGQILGDCGDVQTPEDACWKLVDCGVIPLDQDDPYAADWGTCKGRLDRLDASTESLAVACVAAASCDQLTVQGSPSTPWQWPDCLEVP